MSEATQKGYMLRMRQLPRPEYHLMKKLVKHYDLHDETELFAVALRLLSEVEHYQPEKGTGMTWITQVIDSFRSLPDTIRTTEYSDTE